MNPTLCRTQLMKRIVSAISLCWIFSFVYAQETGINTTNPNSSAMLEMVATDKGLLIPSMTRAQRDAIPSPASGLLVYQTNEDPGFYVYSAAWIRIGSPGTVLADADGDTKIQVEESPDEDIIRMDLAGSERLTLIRNGSGTTSRMEFPANGNNLFIGESAGISAGSGTGNTAVGEFALEDNVTGDFNTAFGKDVLRNNTAHHNSGIGSQALLSNTTGTSNLAIGASALYNNTIGDSSTVVGYQAGFTSATASRLVAAGTWALRNNTTGIDNTAVGHSSLYQNTTGQKNSALGKSALSGNTTGSFNTAVGNSAFTGNSGQYVTALGYLSLADNSSGDQNTGAGSGSLRNNTIGDNNTGAGYSALYNSTSGNNASGLGANSAYSIISSSGTTAVGSHALIYTTGIYNTAVGYNTLSTASSTNTLSVALGSESVNSYNFLASIAGIGYNTNVNNFNINDATPIGANARVDEDNVMTLGSVSGVNGASTTVQVGIGTSDPHESALLEIKSSNKGVLLPRMNSSLRQSITSGPEGLMVYDTDTHSYWFYNGTVWVDLNQSLTSMGATAGQSIAFGPTAWHAGYPAGLADLDGDTRATLEKTPDADAFTIQLGTYLYDDLERFNMHTNANGQLLIELPNNNRNVLMGPFAGGDGGCGPGNTALGNFALSVNYGSDNTAAGSQALQSNFSASQNIAIGHYALGNNQYSGNNLAIGNDALSLLDDALVSGNIGIGYGALDSFNLNILGLIEDGVGIGYKARMDYDLDDAVAIGHLAYAGDDHCIVLGSTAGINEATSSVNVGVGTTAPIGGLHIKSNSSTTNPQLLLEDESNGFAKLAFRNDLTADRWTLNVKPESTAANARFFMFFNQNNLTLHGNGNAVLAGTLTQNSDRRMKKNILPLCHVLPDLTDVHGYQYQWIDTARSQAPQIGFIAQEIQKAFPSLSGLDDNHNLTVNYPAMTAVLLEALKELHIRQEQLDAQLVEQQQRLQEVKTRIHKLKQAYDPAVGNTSLVKTNPGQ